MLKPWEKQPSAKTVIAPALEGTLVVAKEVEPSTEGKALEGSHKHSVLSIVGGTRSERYQRLVYMEEQFSNKQSVHLRKAFVGEYIKDFCSIGALRRLVFGKTEAYYASKSRVMMKCAYVNLLVDMVLEEIKEDAIVGRKDVLRSLKKEMHNNSPDATAATRIAATRALGKLLGMEIDRSINVNLNAPPPAVIADATETKKFLSKVNELF